MRASSHRRFVEDKYKGFSLAKVEKKAKGFSLAKIEKSPKCLVSQKSKTSSNCFYWSQACGELDGMQTVTFEKQAGSSNSEVGISRVQEKDATFDSRLAFNKFRGY